MSAPIRPAPIAPQVDHIGDPRGFEPVELDAPPPPRRCIAPPADDRFELLRAFVVDDINGYKVSSARVLARRAELGDREAWDAVARDMTGPGRGSASDVAEELARGNLDKAVIAAAMVCGDFEEIDGRKVALPEKWLRETREERARKAGA